MRKTLIFLLALTVLLMAVGCGNSGETLDKITLNEVTHSVFYAPQYAAIYLGYFEENGIEVELVNGGGADKSMTALISGDADFALMGPEAAIYVQDGEFDDAPKIIAQLTQTDGSFLVGREDIENFQWSDLEGSDLIGGRKGGMPLMTLEHVLRQNGLEPGKDINVITNIQFDLMGGAFAAGEGDYVTLFEPTASEFELAGKGYVLTSVGEGTEPVSYTCYMTRQSLIEEDPDLVQRFVDAIAKAQNWVAETDALEVAQVISPAFPDTDVDVLASSIERYRAIDAWLITPALNEPSVEHMMEILIEAGELEAPVDISTIYDPTFAQNAT